MHVCRNFLTFYFEIISDLKKSCKKYYQKIPYTEAGKGRFTVPL